MTDNKDKKTSVIPGTPDYYGTGGEVKGWLDQNLGSYLESNPGLIQARAILGGAMAGFCPAGASIGYGGDTAPPGWVFEDGSTYDAVTNPGLYLNLYTAIGIKYGGTGQADFKVPDSRGRVDVMIGSHADVSTLGNTDGNANANRSPLHTHANNVTLSGSSVAAALSVTPVSGGSFLAGGAGTSANITTGGGGYVSTSAAISGSGTISAGGTVGRLTGATRPIDSPAFIVKNRIMKL